MLQDLAPAPDDRPDGPAVSSHVRPLPSTTVPGILPGFLEALGLYGLQCLEVPLLASLAGGEPLLLVGTHGAAKTALVRMLCELAGLRFHAYDASKALFEDVIGFPNPASLGEGLVEYVPTPLSIWGKQAILIDELSRATPDMQNKWLEVVRARSVMGVAIDGLDHVFGAMNPPDYLGAGPLDAALVGRFAWVVHVPDVASMREDDVLRVIRATTSEDARLLPRPTANDGPCSLGKRVAALVAATRSRFAAVQAARADQTARYVHEMALGLRAAGVALDGRRLGMIHRNLLLGLALRQAAEALPDDLDGPVLEILHASLPGVASDEPIDDTALFAAHAAAFRSAFEGRRSVRRAVTAVLGEPDPDRAIERYVALAGELSVEDHDRVVERFLGPARQARGADRPKAYVTALRLVQAVLRAHVDFPAELVARLLSWSARVTGIGTSWVTALSNDPVDQRPRPLDTPVGALAVRLGLELSRGTPGDPEEPLDGMQADEMTELVEPLMVRLSGEVRS
jgi:MoxR-like ATPase